MSVAKRVWVPRLAWFLATTLTGGGCDLGTKAWAESALAGLPGQSITVIEPWFQLALAYNRGTAFSFVPDLGAMRWVLGIFALVVVIALAFMVARSDADKRDALAFG